MLDVTVPVLVDHLEHLLQIVVGNVFQVKLNLLEAQVKEDLSLEKAAEAGFDFRR